jgi:hypothetical protein
MADKSLKQQALAFRCQRPPDLQRNFAGISLPAVLEAFSNAKKQIYFYCKP